MQVPVQTGVKLQDGSFVTSYPINLEHQIEDTGVSQGQLVYTRGASVLATGPGICRGGIYWDGLEYRVMGTKLVSIEGSTITELGDVGGSSPVRMDYGNERLAIVSDGRAFYWDKSDLTEITDSDLGQVLDVTWIDGYFVFTDGEFSIATSLIDPTDIDPGRYGTAESDPDPMTGVEKLNEELLLFSRHTIETQRNVGSVPYPFATVRGATIPFGCVSANAKVEVAGTIAFVGGAREEPLRVYVIAGGTARRISDRAIESLLVGIEDSEVELEARNLDDDEHLVVHTPNGSASIKIETALANQAQLWNFLHSGRFGPYRPRYAVFDGRRHTVGDLQSNALGLLSLEEGAHFGQITDWQFDVGLLYNEGTGLVLEEIELSGQFPLDRKSAVFLCVTRDGEVWSREISKQISGRREERCIWRPSVRMPAISGARFRGNDRASIARCEINGEALSA